MSVPRNRFHPTYFSPQNFPGPSFQEIQERIAGWLVEADKYEAAGDHVRASTWRKSARDHGYAQFEHMRGLYADLALQHYVDEHWAWSGESKDLRHILDNYKDE